MNINVRDLDLGYSQCEELNTLSKTSGTNLISNLSTDINNLKAHWKGTDATEHINNLIKVYDALVALVTDAKGVTKTAGGAISAIQKVRRSNGGSGNVGGPLDGNAPDASSLPSVESTSEYFCDPSARTDYTLLEQICSDYSSFINKFRSQKDTLMSNWTAGANRENAVKVFDEFDSNSETYNKYLTSAKENLGIAVSNLSQL